MWVAFCKVSQEDRSITKYLQAANIKAVGLWANRTCVPADLHHLFPKSILFIQITAPWSLTYPHCAREGTWCDQKTYNYWGLLTFFFFQFWNKFPFILVLYPDFYDLSFGTTIFLPNFNKNGWRIQRISYERQVSKMDKYLSHTIFISLGKLVKIPREIIWKIPSMSDKT